MAPSKRKDSKGSICIYVEKNTIARFKDACDFFGLPMSVVITAYMEHKIKEYDKLRRDGEAGDSRRTEKQD